MALVLVETVAGGASLLFLTPLWGEVRRGFFKLAGLVLLVLALAAWGSIAAGYETGSGSGKAAEWLALAVAGTTLAWAAMLFLRAEIPARVLGVLSVLLSGATLVAVAGTSGGSHVAAFIQLLAGSALMGCVMDGLLLGHWYLTDRGLSRRPINRFALFLIVAVTLEAVSVVAGGFGSVRASPALNPLLTAAGLAQWVALGMVGATALIAVMIRLTLRGERATAVQSATGFFYLAVVTAFAGELATKVRFLTA